MLRQMIRIDEEACIGCGLCVTACHEGAIAMQDGKARLIRDDYCDGLGNCLPVCPAGAISFEMREAAPYDEEAVKRHLATRGQGCEGARAAELRPDNSCDSMAPEQAKAAVSELRQWPVQIKLVPANAPFFSGADLLIAADCTAFACGDFHARYMRGRVTLAGCTKLDAVDYSEKLAEIFRLNDVKSVLVVRMDVPCCGGMERAVADALLRGGRELPAQVAVIGRDGHELRRTSLTNGGSERDPVPAAGPILGSILKNFSDV